MCRSRLAVQSSNCFEVRATKPRTLPTHTQGRNSHVCECHSIFRGRRRLERCCGNRRCSSSYAEERCALQVVVCRLQAAGPDTHHQLSAHTVSPCRGSSNRQLGDALSAAAYGLPFQTKVGMPIGLIYFKVSLWFFYSRVYDDRIIFAKK